MIIAGETETETYTTNADRGPQVVPNRRAGLVAAGSVVGAIAASSCCVVPLLLFSVGIGGAWIGNLTALAPYQPIFVVVTIGILVYGYYLVFWKPRTAYADGSNCASPMSGKVIKSGLWAATALVAAASVFPFVAPYLLGVN